MSDWSLIKLEMARSADYPFGSVSRAYLIRVPLDRVGMIDGAGVAQNPKRATVRRFWPNEPDQSGYVVKCQHRWGFREGDYPGSKGCFASMPDCSIRAGALLKVIERNGTSSPFRVAEISPI
jgi:hypothetical protein